MFMSKARMGAFRRARPVAVETRIGHERACLKSGSLRQLAISCFANPQHVDLRLRNLLRKSEPHLTRTVASDETRQPCDCCIVFCVQSDRNGEAVAESIFGGALLA